MSAVVSRLGDQAVITMGQSPPGESYNRDRKGAPLLNGPSEFGSLHPLERQWTTAPTKFCRPGDILFCVRGATAGRLNIADKEYCIGRGLAAIRSKDGQFDGAFLRFVLARGYSTFQARGTGSTFINISSDELANFEVPVLPINEQQRIAGLLDRADALRTKRRLAVTQLSATAAAIFVEMFGDPVANPKGWTRRRFGDLVTELRYGTSNKSASHGNPTLRIPNVVNGLVSVSDLKFVPVEEKELERFRLADGDLLFVRTNGNPAFVGRCAIFDAEAAGRLAGISADQFIFASYLIRARLLPDISTPTFIREFMLGQEGRRQLRARSRTSAGQFNINTEGLRAILIPVPPLSLQTQFDRKVEALQRLRTAHRASLAELDALFASLQHRAFRGEL